MGCKSLYVSPFWGVMRQSYKGKWRPNINDLDGHRCSLMGCGTPVTQKFLSLDERDDTSAKR